MGDALIALAPPKVYNAFVRLLYRRAERHRPTVDSVTFVAVTGSCGKTTTKDLTRAVLARGGRVTGTPGTHNSAHWVPRTVLGARPGDAFCVQELGASGPGSLDRPVALVRPRVAVITTVGNDHRSAFRTLDLTAAEKRKVVEAVPPDGLAVLNADDPRVLAMAPACRGRVVTFGLGEGADVRAEAVGSAWPAHLGFVVRWREESARVETRLNGTHFVHACLAAIATGLSLGVPLGEIVAALREAEPTEGRLSEVAVGGVTFVRDDMKAPVWTVDADLEFLRTARARRRVIVFGTLSDYAGRASATYGRVARQALDVADEVLFVGPQAERSRAARAHPRGEALGIFATAREASAYLERVLRPGDLVLLKGSHRTDHLQRLALARQGSVACWRERCGRRKGCDGCLLLRAPRLPALPQLRRAPGAAERLGA